MSFRAALLLLLPALMFGASANAQGGYTDEKHPELGMDFPRPRSYEAVPTQPTDTITLLYFVEKQHPNPKKKKAFRPEFYLLKLEAEEGGEENEERTQVGPRAGTFEAYVKDRLGKSWTIVERADKDPVGDFRVVRDYELKRKKSSLTAWARSFERREGSTVLFGVCVENEEKQQRKIWRRIADKLEFYAPEEEEGDRAKIQRYYDRRDFSLVDHRIGVRSGLVKGWKADDTENFIFVYSTKDEALLRSMKSELEAIRKEYVKLFAPAREVTAVSTVRICKDKSEYMKYGGSAGSAGYWNSRGEELVFYDNENVDGKMGSGKANTRIVLYHEAFHQYIFYAVGELAPHSWYNEGTGDYFSGAKIRGGKVKSIGVNPWRIQYIQAVIEAGRTEDWEDILAYEQPEFYQPQRRGKCYAQAWSMIYFLRKSKDVAKHPQWSRILDVYYETLKATHEAEMAKLEQDEEAAPEEYAEAHVRTRKAALEKAFEGVNLLEIEDAWREFTLDLKVPK